MKTNDSTKHTAGPYSVSGIADDNNVMAFIPRLGHKVTVAIVPGWNGIKPSEHEANKALFCAAPEMLSALELAHATIDRLTVIHGCDLSSTQGTRDVINAAIAKAKGSN